MWQMMTGCVATVRLYADGFSASMSPRGYSKELRQIRRALRAADGDDGAGADRATSRLSRVVPGKPDPPDHGLRLRADRHRHLRGDRGPLGDPPSPGIHAERG